MPQLPAIETSDDAETARLIDKIKLERDGQLLLLYKVLLNSPALAAGWLNLLTAVRQKTSIPGLIRELVILRIAVLNHAAYEFDAHLSFALREGVPDSWVESLRVGAVPRDLPPPAAAALRYTDEMTRNVVVSPETHAVVAKLFSAKEVLELTVTIAAYNMVSRVLVALEIDNH